MNSEGSTSVPLFDFFHPTKAISLLTFPPASTYMPPFSSVGSVIAPSVVYFGSSVLIVYLGLSNVGMTIMSFERLTSPLITPFALTYSPYSLNTNSYVSLVLLSLILMFSRDGVYVIFHTLSGFAIVTPPSLPSTFSGVLKF